MVLRSVNLESQHVDPQTLKGDPHNLGPLFSAFVRYLKPERILDPTGGSGVTQTVAEAALIPAVVSDLNGEEPTDLFSHDEESAYDLVFFHPDLWMSRAEEAAHPHDLGGRMTWDAYVDLASDAIEHLATTLRPGGHLVAVCPITRRRGTVRDLARDLVCLLGAPSEPTIIHPHPSSRSRGTMYGKRFIPIAHDHVLVWSKEEILGGPRTADPSDADDDQDDASA